MPSANTNETATMNVNRKGRRTVAGKRARSVTPTVQTEADVARRAYLIYLEEGCPQGRHLEHWIRAETELRG